MHWIPCLSRYKALLYVLLLHSSAAYADSSLEELNRIFQNEKGHSFVIPFVLASFDAFVDADELMEAVEELGDRSFDVATIMQAQWGKDPHSKLLVFAMMYAHRTQSQITSSLSDAQWENIFNKEFLPLLPSVPQTERDAVAFLSLPFLAPDLEEQYIQRIMTKYATHWRDLDENVSFKKIFVQYPEVWPRSGDFVFRLFALIRHFPFDVYYTSKHKIGSHPRTVRAWVFYSAYLIREVFTQMPHGQHQDIFDRLVRDTADRARLPLNPITDFDNLANLLELLYAFDYYGSIPKPVQDAMVLRLKAINQVIEQLALARFIPELIRSGSLKIRDMWQWRLMESPEHWPMTPEFGALVLERLQRKPWFLPWYSGRAWEEYLIYLFHLSYVLPSHNGPRPSLIASAVHRLSMSHISKKNRAQLHEAVVEAMAHRKFRLGHGVEQVIVDRLDPLISREEEALSLMAVLHQMPFWSTRIWIAVLDYLARHLAFSQVSNRDPRLVSALERAVANRYVPLGVLRHAMWQSYHWDKGAEMVYLRLLSQRTIWPWGMEQWVSDVKDRKEEKPRIKALASEVWSNYVSAPILRRVSEQFRTCTFFVD